MLSDEEKEAVEWLKRLVKINKRDNLKDTFAEILLNFIEKQSKEIEELKEKNKELNRLKGFEMLDIFNMGKQSSRQRIEFDYVDKEKIKAKMKEKEWALENYDSDKADYKQSQAIGGWSVLQSLLEKEKTNEKM